MCSCLVFEVGPYFVQFSFEKGVLASMKLIGSNVDIYTTKDFQNIQAYIQTQKMRTCYQYQKVTQHLGLMVPNPKPIQNFFPKFLTILCPNFEKNIVVLANFTYFSIRVEFKWNESKRVQLVFWLIFLPIWQNFKFFLKYFSKK